MFAGNHYIQDTHALRMLDTRLGASFTTALPFIFALLAISVLGPSNVLVIDGLKPRFTLDDMPDEPLIEID